MRRGAHRARPGSGQIDEPSGSAGLLLVLGHGAGGGVATPDLLAVTRAATAVGVTVARVEQPYRVAGRRAPAPAAHLDDAWVTVVGALRDSCPGLAVVTGGRSSGGRVACRTAAATGAAGVVALAFPLRPPRHPERSRAAELAAAGMPVLVVNGARDPFGVPEAGGAVSVRAMPGADHSLRSCAAEVGELVARWLTASMTGATQRGKQSAGCVVGTDSRVRRRARPSPEDP